MQGCGNPFEFVASVQGEFVQRISYVDAVLENTMVERAGAHADGTGRFSLKLFFSMQTLTGFGVRVSAALYIGFLL